MRRVLACLAMILSVSLLSGCGKCQGVVPVASVQDVEVPTNGAVLEAAPVTTIAAEEQDPGQLQTDGFGKLTGTVTLDSMTGDLPPIIDLTQALKDKDAKCCLGPKCKPEEKVDMTWVVDPKTKGVANVMVWLKAPAGNTFAIHDSYKKRDKESVTFDQPHCQYLPHVAGFNPFYMAGGKPVMTGQKLIFKNSAGCNHNVRVLGDQINNKGFNTNLPPETEIEKTTELKPQRLPLEVRCDIHPWMSARLFIFDHPYYAITKSDGSYEIPYAPAGAEISVFAWHEGMGWVLTSKGQPVTVEKNKTKTMDFKVKYDPNAK